jgi:hypothetical protein
MALLFLIEGSMITAVWTYLRMFLNSKFHHFRVKCWILQKPVLGDADGNLNFPVPSNNRLNQTEPTTFSIVLCWTFSRHSVFLYLVCWLTNFRNNINLLIFSDWLTFLKTMEAGTVYFTNSAGKIRLANMYSLTSVIFVGRTSLIYFFFSLSTIFSSIRRIK